MVPLRYGFAALLFYSFQNHLAIAKRNRQKYYSTLNKKFHFKKFGMTPIWRNVKQSSQIFNEY